MRAYFFIALLFILRSVDAQVHLNLGGGTYLNAGKITMYRTRDMYSPSFSAVLNLGISKELVKTYYFESLSQLYWVRLNRTITYDGRSNPFLEYHFQGMALTNSFILGKNLNENKFRTIKIGFGYRFVLYQQGIKFYDNWKYTVRRFDYKYNETNYYNHEYAIQSKAILANFKYIKHKPHYSTFLSFTAMYKFPTWNDYKWNRPKGVPETRSSPYLIKEDNFFQFELTAGFTLPLKKKQ